MLKWILKSFKRQILVMLTSIILLITIVSGTKLYINEKEQLQNILKVQVMNLTHMFSISISKKVFYNKFFEISSDIIYFYEYNNNLSSTLGSLFQIKNIAVVNKENRILGHSNPLNNPIDTEYKDIFYKDRVSNNKLKWNKKNDFLYIKVPIYLSTEVIGYTYLDIDTKFLHNNVHLLLENIFLIVFVLIVVLILFVLIFVNLIERPLYEMKNKLDSIGDGNINFPLTLKREDEFFLLAQSLQNADKRIHKQKTKLLKTQNSLESMVKIRTLELKNKANELESALINLKKSQEHLIETEKMSALGSLVVGLAHEVNTPIGISLTGITHIENETETISKLMNNNNLGENDFLKYIEMITKISSSIHKSLFSAAKLISSFKQIAIDQHIEEKRKFNLKKYCDKVILSLYSEIKSENINIKNEIDESILINSYAGIYSQLITNFIINSLMHAFDDKTVDAEIIIKAWIEKNNLYFTYEDNGKGIDNENINKIFEPFFTTKLGHGGSGLGLSIVYNLVKYKLNGNIFCKNKKNGIKITINIPIQEL